MVVLTRLAAMTRPGELSGVGDVVVEVIRGVSFPPTL